MANLILFLFLAFLPFGQIIRLPVTLAGSGFYLNISDAVAIFALGLTIISKVKYPRFWKAAKDFLIVVGFSLIASLSFFKPDNLFTGLFYFVRLVSYFSLFVVFWNLFRNKESFKETVFKGLILSTIFVAVFGWLQYLIYPDLRALLFLGWDEHLLRMAGGFLDPTFTGIFMVFGTIAALALFIKQRKRVFLFAALFILVSLAFTYSRSSYLALGVGLVTLGILEKKVKKVLALIFFFLLVVFILPGGEGEGVKLERVASIRAKAENYNQSIKLAKISPLSGIGYNNVCLAKEIYLGDIETSSHACSGLDASLLFLLVTTGILGIFSFLNLVSVLGRNLKKDIYGRVFLVSGVAVLTHSLFANSLFYSWVLGFLAILLALGVKEST